MRFAAAEVLDGKLEALRLGDHTEVQVVLQRRRQAGHGQHQVIALVLGGVFVVVIHSRAVVVELVFRDNAAQRLQDGRGVQPELADEAAAILGVAAVGDPLRRRVLAGRLPEAAVEVAVPGVPVVAVAIFLAVVVIPTVGAARPVGRNAIQGGHDARQQVVVEQRAGHGIAGAGEVAHVVQPLVLVVAAPQRQAGVASQPPHLIPGLGFHLGGEIRHVLRVRSAGEHEVLPDQDAQRVAQVVEDIVLVDAPAPHAQHVHVRVAGGFQQHLVPLGGDRAHERIGRDPVGAPGEDRHAVEHEAEEARPRLRRVDRLVEGDGADAGAPLPRVHDGVPGQEVNLQRVERRVAQIMRPPQSRVFDRQVGGGLTGGDSQRVAGGRAAARRGQADGGCQRAISGEALDLHAHGDDGFVPRRSQMQGVEVHAAQRRCPLPAQFDRPPQADSRQTWPPVPPEAELSLAHENALLVRPP